MALVVSSTQAHEGLWLNPLGQRKELSLDVHHLILCIKQGHFQLLGVEREKLSVHLHFVFLPNSLLLLGFEVQMSGSVSKGQTDFRGQHLLGVFPTETEIWSIV